jgi:Tfp pilus assembly protein PilE
LVELTIVVVILGVLATLAVPRYRTSVERTKASEAFHYLGMMESSQARYNAENGTFAQLTRNLDLDIDHPEHFSVGHMTSTNWETNWECKLTRNSSSSGFGRYSVTFDQDGFNARKSTISSDLAPNL